MTFGKVFAATMAVVLLVLAIASGAFGALFGAFFSLSAGQHLLLFGSLFAASLVAAKAINSFLVSQYGGGNSNALGIARVSAAVFALAFAVRLFALAWSKLA